MSSSIKMNMTKKFLLAYMVVTSIATFSFLVGFYFYYSYITKTIAKSIQNSLFIGDFHYLKAIIAPLVDDSIQSIKILDIQSHTVFFHEGSSISFLRWPISHSLYGDSYVMSIAFDITIPVLLLIFIYLLSLVVIYPISYIEKQNQDKRRREFLLSLSQQYAHDIRSPLSSLNLISYQIQDPNIKDAQKMISESILQASNIFLGKIKKYAENQDASLESNSDMLNNKDLSLSVENLIKLLQTEFSNRGISRFLSFNSDLESEVVIGRTDLITPIMRNLIQNSIDATGENTGKISVNFKKQNQNVLVSIEDNGKGIPESILKKLGHKKVSYGKDNNLFSGSGVGLYNAYRDLKSIGATLNIQSEVNKGTKISICLKSI